MQPMQLTTDWITIGTAGPTVDGRKISEKMLTEAAESYDPDEYTAVISSDHMLWMYGNFGEVCKVRTSTDKKDRTILQAKIHPNRKLIEMNALGQRLHTSMELDSDFAGTGKAYLMGLAITDEPASLGTSQLKFSRTKNFERLIIGDPEELETIHFNQADTPKNFPKDTETSFFKSLFQKVSNELKSSEISTTEDAQMTNEQFNTLKELYEKQLTATENLAILLTAKGNKNGDGNKQEESKEGKEKQGDNGEEMKTFMTDVTTQLKSISEKLEKAITGQPGTKIPMNTGTGSEAIFV